MADRQDLLSNLKAIVGETYVVHQPEDLIDRLVVCCANLAPRKMRFGSSESRVLAAGPGGDDIFLLAPDSGAVPGQRVH